MSTDADAAMVVEGPDGAVRWNVGGGGTILLEEVSNSKANIPVLGTVAVINFTPLGILAEMIVKS
jgi:hypothetical protein